MKYFIYSVYDSAAEAYLPPFMLPTEGMALRTFADCCNDPNHNFGRNPDDYTIFLFGMFDDVRGKYELEKAPISKGVGIEFVKRKSTNGQADWVEEAIGSQPVDAESSPR